MSKQRIAQVAFLSVVGVVGFFVIYNILKKPEPHAPAGDTLQPRPTAEPATPTPATINVYVSGAVKQTRCVHAAPRRDREGRRRGGGRRHRRSRSRTHQPAPAPDRSNAGGRATPRRSRAAARRMDLPPTTIVAKININTASAKNSTGCPASARRSPRLSSTTVLKWPVQANRRHQRRQGHRRCAVRQDQGSNHGRTVDQYERNHPFTPHYSRVFYVRVYALRCTYNSPPCHALPPISRWSLSSSPISLSARRTRCKRPAGKRQTNPRTTTTSGSLPSTARCPFLSQAITIRPTTKTSRAPRGTLQSLSIDPLRYENYSPPLYYLLAAPIYALPTAGWRRYGCSR